MEGLIYKQQPYLENSRLLFVYTKIGKVTLIANGVQKQNSQLRNLTQYLTYLSFEATENKAMYRLKQPKLLDDFSDLKTSYQGLKSAALILELIDKVIVANEDHQLILAAAIEALKGSIVEASLSFSIKLLAKLGYQPNLIPNGKPIIGFSILTANLVYEGDLITPSIDTATILIVLKLANLSYDQLPKLTEEQIKIIKQFVYDYYELHLQIQLKTLR